MGSCPVVIFLSVVGRIAFLLNKIHYVLSGDLANVSGYHPPQKKLNRSLEITFLLRNQLYLLLAEGNYSDFPAFFFRFPPRRKISDKQFSSAMPV
jgi:hypothetical protein